MYTDMETALSGLKSCPCWLSPSLAAQQDLPARLAEANRYLLRVNLSFRCARKVRRRAFGHFFQA